MNSLNIPAWPATPALTLPDGTSMPSLGLGTWRMGEVRAQRRQEVAVLQHAMAAGITLIDTAEMYGEGGAEEVVGEALRATILPRDKLFIVSKVYPWNASRRGTLAACERSLRRLGIDAIDLYLLHWRGEHPLADTIEAFEALRRVGKIRHWGVSNFDTVDMRELYAITLGQNCAANQVYFNLARRWPEATLLPWLHDHRIATMAYSPLDQGKLGGNKSLMGVAARHEATPAQVALAWLIQAKGAVAIPKTSRVNAVDEILGVRRVKLEADDLAQLGKAFPPPQVNAHMETT